MPTKESIYIAGQNLGNLLAGVGAKLKEDRRQSIKESIDLKYSKGKSLFYDETGKERSSVDINKDLLEGINAYTSLGFKDEASALKDYYEGQTKQMNLDRSNAYWRNVVEMNTNTKFPVGDVPQGVDLSKVPIREKGTKMFTAKETIRNGRLVTELWNFDPNAETGKEWQLGQTLPGYDVNIPSSYGQNFKSTTPPQPETPRLKSMSLWNKKTNQPEVVEFNDLTGKYTKGGKEVDINDYRPQTDNEQKGEQVQKKTMPDDAAIYSKFLDEQKDTISSLFEESEQELVRKYIFERNGDAITALKERYKDKPEQLKFIDKMYNLRENQHGEKTRILDTYFK